ncbi:MAG: hypothetical protein AAGA64_14185 [Bacteroidota bacterium]
MNIKYIILILVGAIISPTSNGQLRYPTGLINVNTNPGGIAEQIVPMISTSNLNAYIDEGWKLGTIFFENGDRLAKVPLRYDLVNSQLEIKIEGKIRVAPGKLLNAFEWHEELSGVKRYFVRNSFFENAEEYAQGFYELINEGDINILRYYNYERLKPNYNPALDVGSRTASITVTEKYYLSIDLRLHSIPKAKKEFFILFSDKVPDLESKLREAKLSHKKNDDLKEIVKMVNQIISEQG